MRCKPVSFSPLTPAGRRAPIGLLPSLFEPYAAPPAASVTATSSTLHGNGSRARSGAWLRPPFLQAQPGDAMPDSRRGQYVGALYERSLDIGPSPTLHSERSVCRLELSPGRTHSQLPAEATTPQRSSGRPAPQRRRRDAPGRASPASVWPRHGPVRAIVGRVDNWSEAGPLPQIPNSRTDH